MLFEEEENPQDWLAERFAETIHTQDDKRLRELWRMVIMCTMEREDLRILKAYLMLAEQEAEKAGDTDRKAYLHRIANNLVTIVGHDRISKEELIDMEEKKQGKGL